MLDKETLLKIHYKACVCRAFEEYAFKLNKEGVVKNPVYFSAGQEYISATLSEYFISQEKQIFIQHRGHSTYLNFGGDIERLMLELIGDVRGCANGMGGSASIASPERKIYGHDGFIGSQFTVATGACYGNNIFTLAFGGDAAIEEGYVLETLGWASTKELPIWFIIEDNNLSILTEKNVRRNWDIEKVASAFNLDSFNLSDDPQDIWNAINKASVTQPTLFNINTNRLFWHAGSGIDDPDIPDTHQKYLSLFGEKYQTSANEYIESLWKKILA